MILSANMKLTDWIKEHAHSLGKQYTSELALKRDIETVYGSNEP